jgi:hypothetical protein
MTTRLYQHLIAATLAVIVFMTTLPFIDSVLRYAEDDEPAIAWRSARVLTPVVRPGDLLKYEYTRQHLHQCPADLRRFIMTPNEDIVVRFPVIPGGARSAEDEVKTVQSSVRLPPMLDSGAPWTSGPYLLRMTAVRFCKTAIQYDTSIPDVFFTVDATYEGGR